MRNDILEEIIAYKRYELRGTNYEVRGTRRDGFYEEGTP